MPLSGDDEPGSAAWARKHAERYEASDGTESATLRGRPVFVLTSVGAKTGKLRKTALMRVEHVGVYAVVASLCGAREHPVWYHNLKAHPHDPGLRARADRLSAPTGRARLAGRAGSSDSLAPPPTDRL